MDYYNEMRRSGFFGATFFMVRGVQLPIEGASSEVRLSKHVHSVYAYIASIYYTLIYGDIVDHPSSTCEVLASPKVLGCMIRVKASRMRARKGSAPRKKH
jgi:hypothetical protein